MRLGRLIAVLLVGFAIGCGSKAPEIDASPMSTARAMLEQVANSGVIGSEITKIEAALEQLKQTDTAKAQQLLKELSQLKSLKDAAKIKAKASDMAAQL